MPAQLHPVAFYWLLLATPIVLWDATFLLFRPASFPGESWGWIWESAYQIYMEVDRTYADLENRTVVALGLANVVESCIGLLAILLHVRNRKTVALLLAIGVSTSTAIKTLFFFFIEWSHGFHGIGHNPAFDAFFLYWVPNGIWVVMPTWVVWNSIQRASRALSHPSA